MSEFDIREAFRSVNATIDAKTREIVRLQARTASLESALDSMARQGDAIALLAVQLCEKQGIDPAPLTNARLAMEAAEDVGRVERQPERVVEHVEEVETGEPSLQDALSSGYRLLMFHVGLMRVEDALMPLTMADLLCLEEVYRSADALGRSGDPQKVFALFMLWVDCYARDQVVPRAKKCPSELVVRVSHYVTAALPEDRSKRWTTQKAVREWRKISGE